LILVVLDFTLQIATSANHLPSEKDFQHWLSVALASRCKHAEITLRIIDADESQALNTHYRNQAKPTNVLSFPYQDAPDLCGDLAICATVVAQEARDQAKSRTAHWAHLTLHGALHLLGYDHQADADADIMENLEIELLSQLGYPNPY